MTNRAEAANNFVNWNESWQPPRVKAELNVVHDLNSWLTSRLQASAFNLLEKKEDKRYYGGLGFGVKYRNWTIEPTLAYAVENGEYFPVMRLYSQGNHWRGHSSLEYQLTGRFYYLVQLVKRFTPLIEVGVEAEGWGNISGELMSHGAGLKAVFNLHSLRKWKYPKSKLRLEASIHGRELSGQVKPQFIVGLVFTTDTNKHTSGKRQRRR